MAKRTDRRTFIKASLATPAALALSASAIAQTPAEPNAAQAPPPAAAPAPAAPAPADAPLPQGQIGTIRVSRILLGGNLLTHFTHSRDLQYVYNLAAHYNTQEKIIETMALAEQQGINTLVIHTAPGIFDTLKKYRFERGGKIQWIVCPTAPADGQMEEYVKQVKALAEDKAEAIYLWGVTADKLVTEGRTGMIKKAVDIAKEHGMLSGVGGHSLQVITECEEKGVGADFYIKTFHHHNYPSAPKPSDLKGPTSEVPAYWCREPEKTAEVMKAVEKPWLAFKVMAAGAIPPRDAFKYAFDNGADHILAGMFDFEIAEDVAIAKEVIAGVNRTRPWRS